MTDQSLLAARVPLLKGVSVLCVGDVMLDQFVYGEVERISPEAPIPVLRAGRETAMLGGAGNVVRNLAALGARPKFLTVVGEDQAGNDVTRMVGDLGEVDPCLMVESGRQTTIKTRFIASSQQLLRTDRETRHPLTEICQDRILKAAASLLPTVDVVILSDYGKGVLTLPVLRGVIDRARAAGKPVVVDPKGSDYSIYAGAHIVTPNRQELHQATQMATGDDAQIVAAARHIIDRCGIGNVLVTRSHDGMSLIDATGGIFHLAAEAREVFDVSGAGDTVVATLAAALGASASLEEAAWLANVAAGIVVGKVGTAVVYPSDLFTSLHRAEVDAAQVKVVSAAAALDQVEHWRRQGSRVGFTNGCFDLLHPGHISLLTQCKAHCDRLVVGLNSDASVRRLKGPTRPIQSEASRATVLASLATVDLVVIFDEDTPIELIAQLRPDCLVKGGDYSIDRIVGAELVQSYGGEVIQAVLVQGQSTSTTIARMAELAQTTA